LKCEQDSLKRGKENGRTMPNKKFSSQKRQKSKERSDSGKTVTLEKDNKDGEQDETQVKDQRNEQSEFSENGKGNTETIEMKADAEEKAETETNKDVENMTKKGKKSNYKGYASKSLSQSPDRSKSLKNNGNSMPTSRKSKKTFTSRNSQANFNRSDAKSKATRGTTEDIPAKGVKQNVPFQDDRYIGDNLDDGFFYSNGYQFNDAEGKYFMLDGDWYAEDDVSHVIL
jgi:hypothetical protein